MPVVVEHLPFSDREFLAPTVFLRADTFVRTWNYYSTMDEAIQKWLYLSGQGGRNVIPVGAMSFVDNGTNQTFGINVDFYALDNGRWQPVTYKYLRGLAKLPPIIFRFLHVDLSGVYYAIYDPKFFGMSATKVASASPEKIAALDSFFREGQRLKYQYNLLVGFLNKMAQQPLTVSQQKVFNQGLIILNNLNNELRTIRGVEIGYRSPETVGFPVLLLIAFFIVLSVATAWTVATILEEKEKTKRISDTYDFNKWISSEKQDIFEKVTTGELSQSDANKIVASLDEAAGVANKVAESAAKDTNVFQSIASVVKWGVLGVVGFYLIQSMSKRNA